MTSKFYQRKILQTFVNYKLAESFCWTIFQLLKIFWLLTDQLK